VRFFVFITLWGASLKFTNNKKTFNTTFISIANIGTRCPLICCVLKYFKRECRKLYEVEIIERAKKGEGFKRVKLVIHVRSCEKIG
jgi:hypothetical protein